MAVKVVDAIMGSGKSSAAITYMNEHPEKKFIYITPYLDEATRISEACSNIHFYEPQKKSQYHGSKTLHTIDLVKQGYNIATTHQAFRSYPKELLALVKEKKYTLIIDENVDVLEPVKNDPRDVQMAIDAGYIKEDEYGNCRLTDNPYSGEAYKELFHLLKTRNLIKVTSKNNSIFFYWRLPPDLITSFDEVIILTYLFYGQSIHHFLEMYHIPYKHIGICYSDGVYRFSSTMQYMPDYIPKLNNMIHIIDKPKLNAIGDGKYALSMSWFDRDKSNIKSLKNNISNFFKHICPVDSGKKLWGSYADAEYKLRGKGYSNGFLPFNTKATNKYKNRNVLAYCANIFMNVGQKLLYQNSNIDVREDEYALSVMIQWIWRSAIRDGNEIWIYIPSKRMRTLLRNWITETQALYFKNNPIKEEV